MKIYVASSWRCKYQPEVVALLKNCGHDVYDFRHPAAGNFGFSWKDAGYDSATWDPVKYRMSLFSERAREGFSLDMKALYNCDACICVLPCGRSAHLELGYAIGQRKITAVYMPENEVHEPELMYKACHSIFIEKDELVAWANGLQAPGSMIRLPEERPLTVEEKADRQWKP